MKIIPSDSRCHNDSENVYIHISTIYCCEVINKNVKGHNLTPTWVRSAKLSLFCWKWSQNVPYGNTSQIQNSLLCVKHEVTVVTCQNW